MTERRVAILGATSSVAQHTARLLARSGARLALVARNGEHLEHVATDLKVRGAGTVITRQADLASLDAPQELIDGLAQELGGLDTVLIFHGVLGNQQLAETHVENLRQVVRVNFTSAAELAIAAARRLESATHANPTLLMVGSVAGDRGRASNYVYGAAKGALAVLAQGLTHQYAGRRVRVVMVKPGFIDTPMTQEFEKKGPLWSKPEQIAAIIQSALERGGPVIYAPWFWRWIMLMIRLLPQWVMNRLRI